MPSVGASPSFIKVNWQSHHQAIQHSLFQRWNIKVPIEKIIDAQLVMLQFSVRTVLIRACRHDSYLTVTFSV